MKSPSLYATDNAPTPTLPHTPHLSSALRTQGLENCLLGRRSTLNETPVENANVFVTFCLITGVEPSRKIWHTGLGYGSMAKGLPCTGDAPGSMPKKDRQQKMHTDRKQKHRGNGMGAAGSHSQVAIVTSNCLF